jgi:hypothetical protein
MKSLEELREQSNKSLVDLLFTDVEMALTFVDLARVSRIPELKERRLKEARKACEFIVGRIPNVSLSSEQSVALNEKLAVLKDRLTRLSRQVYTPAHLKVEVKEVEVKEAAVKEVANEGGHQ